MAFDAGSVIGHFTLDSSGYVSGANKIGSANSGITGSMIKANLLTGLFEKGLSALVGALKACPAKFIESEKALAQLNAVLKSTNSVAGVTKTQALGLADSMSKLTGIDDDAILSAENLLLTFTKIGKETFPAATQAILDVSTALGQDLKTSAIQIGKVLNDPNGMAAMKRVGVSFSDAQIEMGKELFKTGKIAEYQALVLKELQTEFGGSAKAARDTFGGALKALDATASNLQETIGSYIAAAGRPFVENMIELTQGMNDFLASKEGFEQISNVLKPLAGSLNVVWSVATSLFDIFTKLWSGVGKDLSDAFTKVVGKGNESSVVFTLLGGALKVVSIGTAIFGKYLKGVIQFISDLVVSTTKSIGVMQKFGEALLEPLNSKKWDAVKEAGNNALASWGNLGKNVIDNVKDTVKTVTDEINTFSTDVKINADNLSKQFKDGVNKMDASLKTYQANLSGTEDKTNNLVDASDSATKAIADQWSTLSANMNQAIAENGLFSGEASAAIGAFTDYVFEQAGKVLDVFSDAFNQIASIVSMQYDNELTLVDNDYKNKKKYIEDNVKDEAEKEKQLEALEKDHDKKVAEIKKKQFEANKTASVIAAIISTAQAVMTTFSQFGWPWGIIPAAIMAGIGAVQVATIASQPVPEFEKGGIAKGSFIAGEKGPELVTVGQTSRVFPADETQQLLGGNGDFNFNNFGDLNTEMDVNRAMRESFREYKSMRNKI